MKIRIRIDDILIGLIFLFPILRYYNIPLLDISFQAFMALLIFAIGISTVISRRKNFLRNELSDAARWYRLFIIWLIIITAIYELFTNINIHNLTAGYNANSYLIAFLMAINIGIVLSGKIDTTNCFKIYSGFIYVILAVYVLQWVLFLFGTKVSFKLPFEYSSDWYYMSRKIFGMSGYPTSLFSEKSHFCEYVIPYIGICLFSENIVKQRRMMRAILLSCFVVITASGNGIVTVLLTWSLYFVGIGRTADRKNLPKRIAVLIFGGFLLIGLLIYLSTIPRFAQMFSTLFTSEGQFTSSKADYRIYRGFDIFMQLPGFAKIFGVGYNHMAAFANQFDIVSAYERSWSGTYEYFSAITMVLLYSGISGCILFCKHLLAMFKTKSGVTKGLIVIMFALMFSCEMLLKYSHLMFILVIVATIDCKYRENIPNLENNQW